MHGAKKTGIETIPCTHSAHYLLGRNLRNKKIMRAIGGTNEDVPCTCRAYEDGTKGGNVFTVNFLGIACAIEYIKIIGATTDNAAQ